MTSLFRLSIASWFSVGKFYVSTNLSTSSRWSTLLAYNSSALLLSSGIFLVMVVMSSLSFLILFKCILSLFFLMNSHEKFTTFVYLLKKHRYLFCWSFLLFSGFFFFLVFILFISSLIFVISFCRLVVSLVLLFLIPSVGRFSFLSEIFFLFLKLGLYHYKLSS